jgi:hypothetical protein
MLSGEKEPAEETFRRFFQRPMALSNATDRRADEFC